MDSKEQLGIFIRKNLDRNDRKTYIIAIFRLNEIGLYLHTVEYAEWLKRHGLRMLTYGKICIKFMIAPELPYDLKNAIEEDRENE